MNRGRVRPAGGYTIVETLIFLAVSGAMFVAAMLFIGGRQAKAEFTQSVRDFESSLEATAHDVSNGYYSDLTGTSGQISCTVDGGGNLHFATAGPGDTQGSNKDCIFAGKAVQFGPTAGQDYALLTIAGRRSDSNDVPVTNYTDAHLTAAAPTGVNPSWPDATVTSNFEYGATVSCVFYATQAVALPANHVCSNLPANTTSIDTLSFITTFVGTDVVKDTKSGTIQVDVVVPTAGVSSLGNGTRSAAELINTYSTNGTTLKNPTGGTYVCLNSGGTNQYGIVKLGGEGSQFATSSNIFPGSCT